MMIFSREYGVLCENRPLTQQDQEYPKLILLLHLSCPIHGVKLFLPNGAGNTKEPLRVDLFTTCYDRTLLWYEDILNQGLVQSTPIPDLSVVSCVNCITIIQEERECDYSMESGAERTSESGGESLVREKEKEKKGEKTIQEDNHHEKKAETIHHFQLLLGDYANKVHTFRISREQEGEGEKITVRHVGELSLNDCIYQIQSINTHCIITTRQGVYIY